MQTISKTSRFSLLILFFSIVFATIIYSCHKDVSNKLAFTQSLSPLEKSHIDIKKIQSAYNSGIKNDAVQKVNDISQQSLTNMVGTLNVDWSTYTLQTYSDSTQIVEFSMPDDSLLYVVGAAGQGDTVWCRNKTEAVFILKNDSLEMSFFMKVIENLSPTNSASVIEQLHYLQIPAQFNGQVLYFTLNRQLINGYGWQNGQIVSAISPNALPVQPGQQTDHLKGPKSNELYYTCTSEQVIYVNIAVYGDIGDAYAVINDNSTTGYVQVCGYADDGSGGSTGGSSGGAPAGGVSGGGAVGGSTTPPSQCPTTTVSSLHGKTLASVAGCPVATPPPAPTIGTSPMLNNMNGNKPFGEYPDICTGAQAIWAKSIADNKEVFAVITTDGSMLAVGEVGYSGGTLYGGFVNYNGTEYYSYPDSYGPTTGTYTGTIHAASRYFIPIRATVHTHSPCVQDGTDGISNMTLSAGDQSLANSYPTITHYIIGCDAVGTFNNKSDSPTLLASGDLSKICSNIK